MLFRFVSKNQFSCNSCVSVQKPNFWFLGLRIWSLKFLPEQKAIEDLSDLIEENDFWVLCIIIIT